MMKNLNLIKVGSCVLGASLSTNVFALYSMEKANVDGNGKEVMFILNQDTGKDIYYVDSFVDDTDPEHPKTVRGLVKVEKNFNDEYKEYLEKKAKLANKKVAQNESTDVETKEHQDKKDLPNVESAKFAQAKENLEENSKKSEESIPEVSAKLAQDEATTLELKDNEGRPVPTQSEPESTVEQAKLA